MCGIAGVLYADRRRPALPQVLEPMADAMRHRGPDARGVWAEDGVGLVHRRLSIIDLEGGDQPIGNEDQSVQVVLNGEIYNYQALRRELCSAGHRFRTASDTEVLVHLYEDEGPALTDRLRGMFAFAVWDRRRRRLLLARDRLGIKPLYVYRDAEKLLFASEIKAILAHPGVNRELDVKALEDYLAFGMVQAPRSIFRRVEKLPAAHRLVVEAGTLRAAPERYWELRFEPDDRTPVAEWREAVRAKVDETVRAHLVADVPVGAFLSGGVDSSLVVASAAAAGARLQTFTIGFKEEAFSELPAAAEVAERFGTEHRYEIATADAPSLLDDIAFHYDEPFADSSALPTLLVARLASRHVKVVLSGDGGDEAFGGYRRYAGDRREDVLRRVLPAWFRRHALAPLAAAWPRVDWLPRPLRAKTLLTNLSLGAAGGYANTLALCRPPLLHHLIAPDLAASLNGYRPSALVEEAYRRHAAFGSVTAMMAADIAVRLPDDYLVKVDRAAMAFGLEVRPPLLDHELMELAARIPPRLKVSARGTKWILKESYRGVVPARVLDGAKRGFEVPMDAWLRGPLRDVFASSLFDPNARARTLVNVPVVERLFTSHLRGTARHGSVLWSLLMLARWAERYLAR